MADLKTNYLGLELKTPLVASASPLSKKVSNVQKMEDKGISAVVLFSLFQEQIKYESLELDYFLTRGTDQFPEALTYFPELKSYNIGPDMYAEHVRKLKDCVSIPIIASLNGTASGDWIKYAPILEQAGADALELNIYFLPTDNQITAQVLEKQYIKLIADVCQSVHIPVALKLPPFFTSLTNMVKNSIDAGVDGFVLFNRFMQPDLDIEALEVSVTRHLSTSADLLLPLRWIAILYGRVKADLALSSGVHSAQDMVKAIMAGANVTMITSEFLLNGLDRAQVFLSDLEQWMETHSYKSVTEMRGTLSQVKAPDPAAFERAQYMRALQAFDQQLP
jgi:dihydroorotate dehydrogenase (fumarate)